MAMSDQHTPETIVREPTLDEVRRALTRPLPGSPAHLEMAPQPRPGWAPNAALPSDCREGGVLILLYPRPDRLYLVLTRRTETVHSHKGQISLPGGAREGDEPLVQTALRETCEELGVCAEGIQVIGRLSALYTPPSNFCIHPFVAHSPATPAFHPDPAEVAEVLEVPITSLLDPSTRKVEYWSDPRFDSARRVPFFDLHGHKVWGATAMILSELVTLLEEEKIGGSGVIN
jgi:8-oxo-dGTP pyrophosphatase MutT (NUDIX family)